MWWRRWQISTVLNDFLPLSIDFWGLDFQRKRNFTHQYELHILPSDRIVQKLILFYLHIKKIWRITYYRLHVVRVNLKRVKQKSARNILSWTKRLGWPGRRYRAFHNTSPSAQIQAGHTGTLGQRMWHSNTGRAYWHTRALGHCLWQSREGMSVARKAL